MLTSSTHGVKAALLRTYKEGGRRVAEPQQHDGLLLYYSTLLPHTDPTRAVSKLHSYLLEGDLRQLWQQGKQRLKTRLRDAHSVYKQPLEQHQQGGSNVARATAAELEHLYGTNGVFRVSGACGDLCIRAGRCRLLSCAAVSGVAWGGQANSRHGPFWDCNISMRSIRRQQMMSPCLHGVIARPSYPPPPGCASPLHC